MLKSSSLQTFLDPRAGGSRISGPRAGARACVCRARGFARRSLGLARCGARAFAHCGRRARRVSVVRLRASSYERATAEGGAAPGPGPARVFYNFFIFGHTVLGACLFVVSRVSCPPAA